MDANAKARAVRRLIDREMRSYSEAAYYDGLISGEFGPVGAQALVLGAKRLRCALQRLGLTLAAASELLSETARREAEHDGTEPPRAQHQMSFLEFALDGGH
jgi:hypothetical protein